MNVRRSIDQSAGPVAFHVAFNNDYSAFSVTLPTGFIIIETKTMKPSGGGDFALGRSVGQAALMDSVDGKPSNFAALVVGGLDPMVALNKFSLYNTVKRKEIIIGELADAPVGIRLTQSHMLIISHNFVRLYDIFKNKNRPIEKIDVYETANNPNGLGCIRESTMIFPGRTSGQIQVVRLQNRSVSIIPAHKSPLRALALSQDEQLMVSASEKGTILRLYSTINCQCLAQFRRGLDQATVFSIEISPLNTYLALTSDKATLHIFGLPPAVSLDLKDELSPSALVTGWQDVEPGSSHPNGEPSNRKWGDLANIPLAPRFLSDVYSLATVSCTYGTDFATGSTLPNLPQNIPGLPEGKFVRGVIGWIGERTPVIVSAGQDPRYEKFTITEDENGKTVCRRTGWMRFIR